MEVMQVLGNRRSIRYYLPHRPVEREKIQKMLEAGRRWRTSFSRWSTVSPSSQTPPLWRS